MIPVGECAQYAKYPRMNSAERIGLASGGCNLRKVKRAADLGDGNRAGLKRIGFNPALLLRGKSGFSGTIPD